MKLLYQKQSPFKLITVYEENGSHLLLLEGRDEIHSEYNPKEFLLHPVTEHYWNYLSLFPLLSTELKKVLIIGLGAGTCARQMLHYRPDLSISGIEVDPDIVDVGVKYFGLDDDKVEVRIGDAIEALKRDTSTYDYIIVDAFIHGNLGLQFTTREFYALVKQHLTPHGIVGINYLAERDWEQRLRLGLTDQFSSLRQVGIPMTYNFVIIASDKEYDFSSINGTDDESKRLKNFISRHLRQL